MRKFIVILAMFLAAFLMGRNVALSGLLIMTVISGILLVLSITEWDLPLKYPEISIDPSDPVAHVLLSFNVAMWLTYYVTTADTPFSFLRFLLR